MTNDFGLLFLNSMKPRRTRLTMTERSFLIAESAMSERPSFGGGLLDCEWQCSQSTCNFGVRIKVSPGLKKIVLGYDDDDMHLRSSLNY